MLSASRQPTVIVGVLPKMAAARVRQTLHQALKAPFRVIAVTSGGMQDRVHECLAHKDVVVLSSALGSMAQCLSRGVAATSQADGWILIPGDAACVQVQMLTDLAQALNEHVLAHVLSGGRRCYPLALSADLYGEAEQVASDVQLRRLLARYPLHGMPLEQHAEAEFSLSELAAAY